MGCVNLDHVKAGGICANGSSGKGLSGRVYFFDRHLVRHFIAFEGHS